MAQTLEELELRIETPLRALAEEPEPITPSRLRQILDDMDAHKRSFRKRLHVFSSDCVSLMPPDIEINGYEPIARRAV